MTIRQKPVNCVLGGQPADAGRECRPGRSQRSGRLLGGRPAGPGREPWLALRRLIRLRLASAPVLAAGVRIERFDPDSDEPRLRACYQIVAAAQRQDDPNAPPESFCGFRGWWVYGQAGVPQQTWLATTDSGTPVGCYLLELPARENKSNAFCYPIVAQAARRRGIGTALVAHLSEQAERAGRALLMSRVRVGGPGAAAIGARPTMRDARRVLDVGPELYARFPGLRAQAAPHISGYTLRRWTGPVPDEMVDQASELHTAMEDAPREPNVEPERWDPARLRAAEARAVAQGNRVYQVAAMHDASGEMAALTEVDIDPEVDGWAFQQITAVTRPHRGHRLGMTVKVAMLDWLRQTEPQVRHIMTFNAVDNVHMIIVNAALGHRITDYFESFELEVAAARTLVPAE
jgi:GNAT superfamily N-acetyltransferase